METGLTVGPLSLQVHGYQFPENADYDDANWLLVTAQVEMPGQAWVKVSGPVLMTAELARFRDEISVLYERLDGEAGLWTIEPNIRIRLKSRNLGAIIAEIELTPDQMTQEHRFVIEMDQSFLPRMQQQINFILERFPVKGHPHI